MVRFYWYGLTVIYLTCCVAGMILGYTWGVGGAILGVVLGATAAAGVATFLNTPEKMENAFYAVLSLATIIGLAWLIVNYWGVRL
jgi:ABC-type lipoprotein release transport system permease subunit